MPNSAWNSNLPQWSYPEPEACQATKVEEPNQFCHDLLDSADDEAIKLSETAMPIIPLVSHVSLKI